MRTSEKVMAHIPRDIEGQQLRQLIEDTRMLVDEARLLLAALNESINDPVTLKTATGCVEAVLDCVTVQLRCNQQALEELELVNGNAVRH